MDISKLIDAAAQAAVEAESPPSLPTENTGSVYHASITHEARQALLMDGIRDERLAAAITLAKAEARAGRVQANGFDVPGAIRREIAHLQALFRRNYYGQPG